VDVSIVGISEITGGKLDQQDKAGRYISNLQWSERLAAPQPPIACGG
jgi:hypothetical protein